MANEPESTPGEAGAARRTIGPGLARAVRVTRRLVGLVRGLLTAAVVALLLVGLAVVGLLALSGRLHWWLGLGLLAIWLAAAIYAVRRVAQIGWALDSTESFQAQFFEALDLSGAAAKAVAVFRDLRGDDPAHESSRAERGIVRRLLRFYALAKVPTGTLDRLKDLPLIAPFLPGSLTWTRVWLAVAAVLTLACPALAIAAAAAGFGPG